MYDGNRNLVDESNINSINVMEKYEIDSMYGESDLNKRDNSLLSSTSLEVSFYEKKLNCWNNEIHNQSAIKEAEGHHDDCCDEKIIEADDKYKLAEVDGTIANNQKLRSNEDHLHRYADVVGRCVGLVGIVSSLVQRMINVNEGTPLSVVSELRQALVTQLHNLGTRGAEYDASDLELVRSKRDLEAAVIMLDQKYARPHNLGSPRIPCESDFEFLRILGHGSFGTVFLAKTLDLHGTYCAIKVMNKKKLLRNHMGAQIVRERRLMSHTNSCPSLYPRLLSSFQDDERLFLVMEYVEGGDCQRLLQVLWKIPEEFVRHFVAEACMAVDFMHMHGVVHRDIKPDNLLITASGHVKVTDFGHSSRLPRDCFLRSAFDGSDETLSASSGSSWQSTPDEEPEDDNFGGEFRSIADLYAGRAEDYFSEDGWINPRVHALSTITCNACYQAPEMLLGCGYDESVDWWSIGILTFHLLSGVTPFEDSTKEGNISENILMNNWCNWKVLPIAKVSHGCVNFILQMLQYLPRDRRGGFRNQHETQALRHEFFDCLDLETIHSKPGPLLPHFNPHVFVWMSQGLEGEVRTLDELVGEGGRDSKVEKPMTDEEADRELELLEDASCFDDFSYALL